MDLSIIIVNWNSKDYLSRCIDTIILYTNGLEYEIIVVDSASYDGCGEMLNHSYPNVHFIQSIRNIGFARANNLGASYAQGSVLLFLNPDTELKSSSLLRLYAWIISSSDTGVVGGKLLNSDGSLQTSCVQPLPTVLNQVLNFEVLQRKFPRVSLWMSAEMFQDNSKPVEVEGLSGACLMIRRVVFEQVGGFSTDYFMYGEDLDLCNKAICAGYKNYYVPESVIIHHGGGSSKKRPSQFSDVMMRESVNRYLKKYYGNWYSRRYRIALTLTAGIRLFLLSILYPSWQICGNYFEWKITVWKWIAILRWSIGREKWTQRYDRLEKVADGKRGY